MAEIEAEYRGRIVSLDLARGLAIVFMVFQHAVLIYAVDRGEQSVVGKLVLLFGSAPAAPVFLFIMGIFLGRPDRGLRRGVRRGIKLIALGYLLNLLRSTLPSLVAGQANVLSETSPSPLASRLCHKTFEVHLMKGWSDYLQPSSLLEHQVRFVVDGLSPWTTCPSHFRPSCLLSKPYPAFQVSPTETILQRFLSAEPC
jgi:hypothetical protein